METETNNGGKITLTLCLKNFPGARILKYKWHECKTSYPVTTCPNVEHAARTGQDCCITHNRRAGEQF